jgi:hypothetical protein
MFTANLVGLQVMYSIRRLILKHGKILSLFTWIRVTGLLRSSVRLCGDDVEAAAVMKHELHSILSLVESLIDRNEFAGSKEDFYALLEECVIDRPDSSAMRLIDYRISNLTPEHPNWIDQTYRLLNKFLYEGVSLVRREKAVYLMHNIYKKHRVLHEADILRKIVLPICSGTIPNERELSVQVSQSINSYFTVFSTT